MYFSFVFLRVSILPPFLTRSRKIDTELIAAFPLYFAIKNTFLFVSIFSLVTDWCGDWIGHNCVHNCIYFSDDPSGGHLCRRYHLNEY